MIKIDIHTHILPRAWEDLEQKYGYGGWVQLHHRKNGCAMMVRDGFDFREVKSNTWDPMVRLKECNQQSVDVQVLSTVPIMFSYWAKAEDTYDLSKFLNDDLAQTIAQFPHRFIGLGTIPMQESKLAVTELERCMNQLHFRGVQIGTNINGKNLNEPEFSDFFSVAESLNASIFIHPWNMMGEMDMQKYYLPWLVGMPAETSRAICSILMGGVLEKFPNLKIAFAHGGGSFPGTLGRIEHGYKVRPDLCAVDSSNNPASYLGEFWVDSLIHDGYTLENIVKIFGEDKVALGTDYPFPLGEKNPGELIQNMNFSESLHSKLIGENALDWLGMKRSDFITGE